MRQGGILIPKLFVNVDNLFDLLPNENIVCHVENTWINHSIYANVCLSVPTPPCSLQKLLSMCEYRVI